VSSAPLLALVSIGIRRDLIAPLRHFDRLEVIPFYRESVYGDLAADEMDESPRRYLSPFDLYRQLVASRPDVIQGVEPFSYYTQPYLWACYLAARRTGAALLVSTLENRPLDAKFGALRAALLRAALRHYFRRACLIIALNDGARANVLRSGGAAHQIERCMWGVWGVDPQEFLPPAARDSEAPPTILFVGRLHEEKGVLVLLEAFARVHRQLPRARLEIVGSGPCGKALAERIEAHGLSECVNLRGLIKNRELPAVFQSADVLCAPSLTTRRWAEQVGAAALQAMAAGLPVVSTRTGAIPEYVPDGIAGVLVEEANPIELAGALLRLLTDPELARRMGARAREYACEHYDARLNVLRGEQLVTERCLAHRL
jgi:glycosyltransferase involved in cell wall biosynthesis